MSSEPNMTIQTLITNLACDDETERIIAAEDLGYANAEEAILPLVERLPAEPSRKVRETIFLALERIDNPAVMPPVVALLESDDAFLRNQAVALLQHKGSAPVAILLKKMREADADVRKFALDAAAGIASPEVEPIFDAAMGDPDINIVIAALEYLGEQRKVRFKAKVEELFLQATEPMLVCAAFSTLLQIGDGDSWLCICRRYPNLESVPSWQLGWWIRALGDFAVEGDIEVFHQILRSHEGNVAQDTIDALERFQIRHGRVKISDNFWKVLQTLIEGSLAPQDKLQVLRIIGGFGGPAAIADYLVASTNSADRIVKLGAIEGIKRLERPDLIERLMIQRRAETDAEIIEALSGGELTR
jgi:hypothetical protein